jgi:hypothetical protein
MMEPSDAHVGGTHDALQYNMLDSLGSMVGAATPANTHPRAANRPTAKVMNLPSHKTRSRQNPDLRDAGR